MAHSVLIRGPFTGPSGYDHHVREFVRAFAQLGVTVGLENLSDWGPAQLPHRLRDPWFEALPAAVEETSAVHFCFPTQVTPRPSRLDLNFTMFEATRIPRPWARAHEHSDLIVVPTEHSRQAWADSGVPAEKLRSCPLGVRVDLYRPGVPPMDMGEARGRPLRDYAVRFLNVSELNTRKNLVGLLKAWLLATSASDDAVLIMKVGCYNPGSLAEFERDVATAQAQAGKPLGQAAAVQFLYNLYPDADMPRVFAAATHYISLSFGEGWDLPMVEAAASGLRLIAPRHSAYLAYLDDDVATLVSAREQPARNANGDWVGPLFVGANWWRPDEDEAVQAIRDAVAGKDARRASARERIADRYTWRNAAARLLDIINGAA